MSRIVIINGHPDPRPGRLVHALACAYAAGALSAGHQVERIDVGRLDFPMLRNAEDYCAGPAPAVISDCQLAIARAAHVVFLSPLWLAGLPAFTEGFLEQVLRPGFAFERPPGLGRPARLLAGRSARVVLTMGMPALLYRMYYRSRSLRTLMSLLRYTGFMPVRATVLGRVESGAAWRRAQWLEEMQELGRQAR